MRPTTGRPTTSSTAQRPVTGKSSGWSNNGSAPSPRPPTMQGGMARGAAVGSRAGTAAGHRPTTASLGLGVPKTASGGRGIQDKMFWYAELKRRTTLIESEIAVMYQQSEEHERNASNLVAFEAKHEKMSEELALRQAALADLNAAISAINQGDDIERMKSETAALLLKKNALKSEWTVAMQERKAKETQIKSEQGLLREEEERLEQKIRTLSEAEQAEYTSLKAKSKTLQEQLEAIVAKGDVLSKQESALQEEVDKNALRSRVVSQLRSLAALQDNKAALDRDIASLTEDSGPSAKERLLESIKTNNQEAAGIERATNEVQESIAKLNMRLAELEGQLGSTQNDKASKFDELQARNEEMSKVMGRFPGEKHAAVTATGELREKIVAAMEQLSVANGGNGGGADAPDDIPSLRREQEKRKDDIRRVQTLEAKLAEELAALQKQSQTLTERLTHVANIDGLRDKALAEKEENLVNIPAVRARRAEVARNLRSLLAQYERLTSQYAANETATNLQNLQSNLRKAETLNFAMRESILQRSAESDYRRIKENVIAMIDECNSQVQEILQKSSVRGPGIRA